MTHAAASARIPHPASSVPPTGARGSDRFRSALRPCPGGRRARGSPWRRGVDEGPPRAGEIDEMEQGTPCREEETGELERLDFDYLMGG